MVTESGDGLKLKPKGLVLASASPRRAELLARLGFPFEVVATGVEEISEHLDGPSGLVRENALLKALHVAEAKPDQLVLGSDTTVCLDGTILGKPANLAEAKACLRRLSGQRHEVFTGVALCWRDGGLRHVFVESSTVVFRTLSEDVIERYVQLVNPLDKAGAYGIQAHRELIIAEVDGSVENVMGLPLQTLETWFDTQVKLGFKKEAE